MSEQPEATEKAAEPKLCKMGCGFFGSNATGDCCSKCWASIKPKGESAPKGESSGDKSDEPKKKTVELTEKPQPSSAETAGPSALDEAGGGKTKCSENDDTPAVPSPRKKKKKKATYKSMMAGMLEDKSASRDIEKEKEKLKDVTGGGHFQKIDKI